MLTRVVKMHFRPEFVADFKLLFQNVQEKIAGFEGCASVQLLQDSAYPEIFFTISQWQSHAALENYRHSELFKNTWALVKPNFQHKAEAWSLLVP